MNRIKDQKNSHRMATNGINHLESRTTLFNPEPKNNQTDNFQEIKQSSKPAKVYVSKYQKR